MSWIGGKKALRELIVSLFPIYYERYIEVFGGGGWVLFHKPPGNDFEVYNDFNGLLVNLYRCVREKPEELMEALRFVLNHQHTAQWNKHMVKRILENERYLGMDGYPQLVTDEEFLAVRLRRGEQNTYAPCPSEIIPIRDKAVCALCGEKMARDTKSRGRPRWRCKNPECGGSVYLDDSIILERVVQKLKVLAHSPECIRLPKAAPASTDALRIENELALCFNRADINPEYMKTLIMAAAAERYAGLNDPTPAHRRALLRQKLELEPENEETLWELFESAVTHVCIGKGGEISLSQKDQKECAS